MVESEPILLYGFVQKIALGCILAVLTDKAADDRDLMKTSPQGISIVRKPSSRGNDSKNSSFVTRLPCITSMHLLGTICRELAGISKEAASSTVTLADLDLAISSVYCY